MKIFLDMVGCRLNQAEIETLARQFRARGHEIIGSPVGADLVVVNTCTVTAQAAADSRQQIRQATHLGRGQVIATGCWATLEQEAAASLPGVRWIIPNNRKESLVSEVLGLPLEAFDLEPLARQPLPGLRARTRAFIKVQDGCDNACTFCITTIARGVGQSRPGQAVLADIQAALEGGTKEIVLTGVHLGSWGREYGLHLSDLVLEILAVTDVPRLRLSSLEPWDLEDSFFLLWENDRLMPHLHLPMQSGSSRVLKRMARKTTPEAYRNLIHAARAAIPDVAITTDVMAGFPGETAEEFEETLALIHELQFAGGHVFPYSARPGTAAARMADQVPHELRKERSSILRAAFSESAHSYRAGLLGKTVAVLWESANQVEGNGWRMEGFSGNYLRISALAKIPLWNRVANVQLTALTETGLMGDIKE